MATVQKNILLRNIKKGLGFGRVQLRFSGDSVRISLKVQGVAHGFLLLLTDGGIDFVGELPIPSAEIRSLGRERILAAVVDDMGRVILGGESGGRMADWAMEEYRIIRWMEGRRKDMGEKTAPAESTAPEAEEEEADPIEKADSIFVIGTDGGERKILTDKGCAEEEAMALARSLGGAVCEADGENSEPADCGGPDVAEALKAPEPVSAPLEPPVSPKLLPRRYAPLPERTHGVTLEGLIGMEGWSWDRVRYGPGEEDCYCLGTQWDGEGDVAAYAVAVPANGREASCHLAGFVRNGGYWVLVQRSLENKKG